MSKVAAESIKHVIICPPQRHCIREVLKDLHDKKFHWAYFGEDISKFLYVEQQLEGRGQHIDISGELQEIARSLRQPYIDYIGRLSIKNNSLKWWSSYFSEKNPFESKIFLYSCYIKLTQHILNSHEQGCFVFFVENNALQRCFIQNLSKLTRYELHTIGLFRDNILGISKDAYNLITRKFYFIAYTINKILSAKYVPRKRTLFKADEQENIFILTWMDSRSFDENGKYHDPFFGDLPLKLKERGKKVVLVPYILKDYNKHIKKIKKSGMQFLVPESFLNISDVLYLTAKQIADIPRKKKYPLFEELEISGLIFDEYRRNWIEIRTVSLLLFYEIIRHWKSAGIPIDVLIFTYENHIREKILSIALREFYPDTYIIGYQHASVSTMYLDHFFSREELKILPFPDRVITNGKTYEELFKDSGYPSEKVVCGGAIRYSSLLKSIDTVYRTDSAHPPTILVTPSISMNEAAELVWKIIKAFEYSYEYRIIIKCHPSMPFQLFSGKLNLTSLPQHFIISNRPVDELLRESDILIYTTTTVCVEALTLGVPALHIESDFIIDMDILDFKPDIRYSARNVDDIKERVEEVFRIDRKDLLEKRIVWKEMALEIFGSMDEHTYDLFLRPKSADALS